MNCYSCGAGVMSTDPNCGHCGVRLASLACPSCFSMTFQDAQFCSSCGSPAAKWMADASARACPGCRELMLLGQLDQTRLHECPKCFGIWLDTASFEHVCRTAEKQAAALGQAQTIPSAGLAPVRYVPCPECQQLMHRIHFARCSGVIVDVCRAHGTWFENHELHRIIHFIRAGGMEESRNREKAELRRERTRVDVARDNWQPMAPVPPAGDIPEPINFSNVISAAADILVSILKR
jgi:Zn-finger nucleic acid-binding protein